MAIAEANRLKGVGEYYFSTKLQEVRELSSTGAPVINLGIGNPDLMPSAASIKALKESVSQPGNHGYQSYRSIPALREAIADWYQKTYSVSLDPANEILPLIGSKEGIWHITMAFVNPGDQVLVPDPGYPAYGAVSKIAGAEVVPYPLREDKGWQIDLDQIRAMDLSKVKVMWINYPHMPTGARGSLHLFKALVDLAREHQFLLCNDNPYSLILNDEPMSLLRVEGAKDVAVELNSLSKSHNMAGWRLGWVAGSAQHIQSILKVKSNIDSGMFLPVQHAAIEALNNSMAWHEARNDTYRERRALVWDILKTLGCTFREDQVGLFVFARVPDHVQQVEQWVDDILYGARVFVTPAFIFGKNAERYIRLSLCNHTEVLEEAHQRIIHYLNSAS